MKRVLLLLGLVFVIAGCSGINETTKWRATGLQNRLKNVTAELAAERGRYDGFEKSREYGKYRRYADRERWRDSFDLAATQLKSAERIGVEVARLVKENDADKEATLLSRLAEGERVLGEAQSLIRRTQRRITALREAGENRAELLAKTEKEYSDFLQTADRSDEAAVDAAQRFPQKAQDLAERRKALAAQRTAFEGLIRPVREQGQAAEPDLALFVDSMAAFQTAYAAGVERAGDLLTRVSQLGRSYSKTLHDMRQDHYVTVGRSSWDNWSDYDTESTFFYGPVKVKPETEELLAARGDTPIEPGVLRELGLDPKQAMPGGHDTAEYWIEDTRVECFHRYKVFENDKQTETDWEKVTEDYFERHVDDLGMDIVVKPYGMYEDETIRVASPPGISYVGNPRYGSWERQSDGSQIWKWAAAYMFFNAITNSWYTRNDYDYWYRNHRGRTAWYGQRRPEEEERYGSGSGVGRYYANSYWVRSGGYARQDESVRGAGSSFRGGGPGGGGK